MPDYDRVRAAGSQAANERVDRETLQRLRGHAHSGRDEIAHRLRALEHEPDIEQVLQVNAATVGLTGLALGVMHDRRWLALPAVVFGFLALHAIHGWCPPVPLFRRLGVRTRQEIDRERYALKAVRGDFDGAGGRTQVAWRAVRH
jgi:hypothetical protein